MSEFSILEGQIRECFGRVVYSHKTHEKMAEGCTEVLKRYKTIQICLSSLTACSALGAVIKGSPYGNIATILLSLASLFVTGYMKGIDPGGSAQKHRDAAGKLWIIRESYLSLLTDLRSGTIKQDSAFRRRDELQKRLSTVYRGAPQTNSKAYEQAKEALQKNEELTFSDDEINKFLPSKLRKTDDRQDRRGIS